MTATSPNPHAVAADITRLIRAAHDDDGQTVLAVIAAITADIGPVGLYVHLLSLIDHLGVSQYGGQWPHVIDTVADILDIDMLPTDDGEHP